MAMRYPATSTYSPLRFASAAQAIQRKYYDQIRTFLSTATDEQLEQFHTAVGDDDSMARFAVVQEREYREQSDWANVKATQPQVLHVTIVNHDEADTDTDDDDDEF